MLVPNMVYRMLGAVILVTWRFRRLNILLSIAPSSSAAAHLVLRSPSTGCVEASERPQLHGRLAWTSKPFCVTDMSWLHCHVDVDGGAGGAHQRHSHDGHTIWAAAPSLS